MMMQLAKPHQAAAELLQHANETFD